jgi:hypothetical protein
MADDAKVIPCSIEEICQVWYENTSELDKQSYPGKKLIKLMGKIRKPSEVIDQHFFKQSIKFKLEPLFMNMLNSKLGNWERFDWARTIFLKYHTLPLVDPTPLSKETSTQALFEGKPNQERSSSISFHDCKLLKDVGEYKEGTVVPTISFSDDGNCIFNNIPATYQILINGTRFQQVAGSEAALGFAYPAGLSQARNHTNGVFRFSKMVCHKNTQLFSSGEVLANVKFDFAKRQLFCTKLSTKKKYKFPLDIDLDVDSDPD